uniref:Uncharacterized protein n=1 Tax=Vespula pensylvanica TaxID=30213 RepID=A0A834JLA3_VESPE|nr:hypothetical protein H0235_018075 [Vespula pensylvanica]
MKEKKDDIPAPTEDDNERRRRRQVDDTHTTAHASPPLQRSRCILNASSDIESNVRINSKGKQRDCGCFTVKLPTVTSFGKPLNLGTFDSLCIMNKREPEKEFKKKENSLEDWILLQEIPRWSQATNEAPHHHDMRKGPLTEILLSILLPSPSSCGSSSNGHVS